MADTDARTRKNDHFTEEDWVDFARGQAAPPRRTRLQQHLEAGCRRCARTVRLWKEVLRVAGQEASFSPPDATLRQVRGDFARRKPEGLLARATRRVALVFDSFRQPLAVGVRAAGASPRQLLYRTGRYAIRLQLEPGQGAERRVIVGQILDEQDPARELGDIAVLARMGGTTLDRTLTNRLGEFLLEPDAAESLQLCVGVAEIGTFAVQPLRGTGKAADGDVARALDAPGGRRRARQR